MAVIPQMVGQLERKKVSIAEIPSTRERGHGLTSWETSYGGSLCFLSDPVFYWRNRETTSILAIDACCWLTYNPRPNLIVKLTQIQYHDDR